MLQNWTKLSASGGGPWPEERSRHAACCLNYGQRNPQLLVTAGEDSQRKTIADAWILDVERKSWKKVNVCTLHVRSQDADFQNPLLLSPAVLSFECPFDIERERAGRRLSSFSAFNLLSPAVLGVPNS